MNVVEDNVNNYEFFDNKDGDIFIESCNSILSSEENIKIDKNFINVIFNMNECNKNFSDNHKEIIELCCDEENQIDLKLLCSEFVKLYKNFQ